MFLALGFPSCEAKTLRRGSPNYILLYSILSYYTVLYFLILYYIVLYSILFRDCRAPASLVLGSKEISRPSKGCLESRRSCSEGRITVLLSWDCSPVLWQSTRQEKDIWTHRHFDEAIALTAAREQLLRT